MGPDMMICECCRYLWDFVDVLVSCTKALKATVRTCESTDFCPVVFFSCSRHVLGRMRS